MEQTPSSQAQHRVLQHSHQEPCQRPAYEGLFSKIDRRTLLCLVFPFGWLVSRFREAIPFDLEFPVALVALPLLPI